MLERVRPPLLLLKGDEGLKVHTLCWRRRLKRTFRTAYEKFVRPLGDEKAGALVLCYSFSLISRGCET
jgi:hypothetical protein